MSLPWHGHNLIPVRVLTNFRNNRDSSRPPLVGTIQHGLQVLYPNHYYDQQLSLAYKQISCVCGPTQCHQQPGVVHETAANCSWASADYHNFDKSDNNCHKQLRHQRKFTDVSVTYVCIMAIPTIIVINSGGWVEVVEFNVPLDT